MRILVVLAAFVIVAGCTTTPDPGSSRPPMTSRSGKKLPPGTPPIGSVMSMEPMVGATVEDVRRPGLMYCAKCGSSTTPGGACKCNELGMPGFGIQPTSRVKRSTSPR